MDGWCCNAARLQFGKVDLLESLIIVRKCGRGGWISSAVGRTVWRCATLPRFVVDLNCQRLLTNGPTSRPTVGSNPRALVDNKLSFLSCASIIRARFPSRRATGVAEAKRPAQKRLPFQGLVFDSGLALWPVWIAISLSRVFDVSRKMPIRWCFCVQIPREEMETIWAKFYDEIL